MAINKSWAERCAESNLPPQPLQVQAANCSIGGNSPTEVYGIIENTPGNTPMNRALGGVWSRPGRASKTGDLENPREWVSNQGRPEPYWWVTGVDRGS